MLARIAVTVTPAMDAKAGERLRRLLTAIPSVKQVTIAYPNRVEVGYDESRGSASGLLMIIRTYGLGTGR